jgi:hypothetical protein
MEVFTNSNRGAAAGNILIAHVEAFKAGTAKERYLTYAELAKLTGGAAIGMGAVLSDVLHSIVDVGLPRGLTLFVVKADGHIDYDASDEWAEFDVGPHNSLPLRKEVVETDWSNVTFKPTPRNAKAFLTS